MEFKDPKFFLSLIYIAYFMRCSINCITAKAKRAVKEQLNCYCFTNTYSRGFFVEGQNVCFEWESIKFPPVKSPFLLR